jgi:transposase
MGIELKVPQRGIREGWTPGRWVIERTFGWFDLFRRLKLRYDQRMHAFKSFHFFASTMLLRAVV